MKEPSNTGERIRLRREYLGMTQEDLAAKMGYSDKSSISKIETSGDNVSMKKIQKLAKALEVAPEDLLNWSDSPAATVISDPEEIREEKYVMSKLQLLAKDEPLFGELREAYEWLIESKRNFEELKELLQSVRSEEKKELLMEQYEAIQKQVNLTRQAWKNLADSINSRTPDHSL